MTNTQFIYELALAQMELAALGVRFRLSDDFRAFAVDGADKDRLLRRLAYFDSVDGEPTDYARALRFNRTRSINQYLTHWIYPYKGKFHPQLVRALLNVLGVQTGETVLDPFVGSGTTLVEAQMLGINAVGFDVSPVCLTVSQVKTLAVAHLAEIEAACEASPSDAPSQGLFAPEADEERFAPSVAAFLRVAHLIALSDVERRRRRFEEAHQRNLQRMLASVRDMAEAMAAVGVPPATVTVALADARNLPLPADSVQGIITSPPYSIALDYVGNDEPALRALGWEPEAVREQFIGLRGRGAQRFELYAQDMTHALREMHRVLAPRRLCAAVVGNVVQGGAEVDTTGRLIEAARSVGFTLERVLDKVIYGLYNVISREYVLLLRKS